MLRRDRQIRMQIHQLMDACLFAFGFWLAYALRANPDIIDLFGLRQWNEPFETYARLYLILIPAAPLILEGQGFYARSPFCPGGARPPGYCSRAASSPPSGWS